MPRLDPSQSLPLTVATLCRTGPAGACGPTPRLCCGSFTWLEPRGCPSLLPRPGLQRRYRPRRARRRPVLAPCSSRPVSGRAKAVGAPVLRRQPGQAPPTRAEVRISPVCDKGEVHAGTARGGEWNSAPCRSRTTASRPRRGRRRRGPGDRARPARLVPTCSAVDVLAACLPGLRARRMASPEPVRARRGRRAPPGELIGDDRSAVTVPPR